MFYRNDHQNQFEDLHSVFFKIKMEDKNEVLSSELLINQIVRQVLQYSILGATTGPILVQFKSGRLSQTVRNLQYKQLTGSCVETTSGQEPPVLL